jgi:hypothetical protein
MPLQIVHKRGRACPVVVCDECGLEIRSARDGNYQWDYLRGGDIYFTHKECCHGFEEGRDAMGAMGFDVLLVFLRNRLRVDMGETAEKAAWMARIG